MCCYREKKIKDEGAFLYFYSLRFTNFQLEKEYRTERHFFNDRVFITIFKTFLFISILVACLRIFALSRTFYLPEILRVSFTVLIYLIYLLLKKFDLHLKYIAQLLSFLFLELVILELEAVLPALHSWTLEYTFQGAFQIGSLQIFIFFFKITWFETLFISIVLQMYTLIRFKNQPGEWASNYSLQTVWFVAGIVMFGIMYYKKEKSDRLNFHEMVKKKAELQFFHDLMKKNIPNPIIIANKKNSAEETILFANISTVKALNIAGPEEVLPCLRKFIFQSVKKKTLNEIKRVDNRIVSHEKERLAFSDLLMTYGENREASLDFEEYLGKLKTEKHSSDRLSRGSKQPSFAGSDPNFNMLTLQNEVDVISIKENEYMDSSSSLLGDDFLNASVSQLNKSQRGNYDERRYFSVQVGSINWEGNEAKLVIFNEVTDNVLRANFKAEQTLNKNKDKLLASVSHQLRTPLNTIISSIEDLKNLTDFHQKGRQIAKLCWRSSQLLLNTISNLIDLSKINTNTLNLDIKNVQVGFILDDVVDIIKFKGKLKGISLIEEYSTNYNTQISCDVDRLKQIILNLLENAIKYTKKGGSITINLALQNVFQEFLFSDNLEEILLENVSPTLSPKHIMAAKFTIEDNGVGIEDTLIPRLFKLYREFRSGDQNEGFIGLGLALSQRLLKGMLPLKLRHVCEIKVNSKPGVGSKFSFMLPIFYPRDLSIRQTIPVSNLPRVLTSTKNMSHRKNYKKPAQQSSDPSNNSIEVPSPETINTLIVDDDHINQLVLKKYLLSFGFNKFAFAENGLEAVKLVQQAAVDNKPFHLILMDCNMPVMDGYEASRRIVECKKRGEIHEPKIVAVTANVASNDAEKCLEAGMNAYLTKPLKRQDFKNTIERIIGLNLKEPSIKLN